MSARRSARSTKGKSPSRLGDGDGWASGAARDWTGDAADTSNNGAQAIDSGASSRAPSSTSNPKNKNVRIKRHHIVAPLLVLQTRVLFWPADGVCGDLVFVFDALLCCVVAPRRGSIQLSLHNRVTDSLATDFQFLISIPLQFHSFLSSAIISRNPVWDHPPLPSPTLPHVDGFTRSRPSTALASACPSRCSRSRQAHDPNPFSSHF